MRAWSVFRLRAIHSCVDVCVCVCVFSMTDICNAWNAAQEELSLKVITGASVEALLKVELPLKGPICQLVLLICSSYVHHYY